jgi:hypothetical protein
MMLQIKFNGGNMANPIKLEQYAVEAERQKKVNNTRTFNESLEVLKKEVAFQELMALEFQKQQMAMAVGSSQSSIIPTQPFKEVVSQKQALSPATAKPYYLSEDIDQFIENFIKSLNYLIPNQGVRAAWQQTLKVMGSQSLKQGLRYAASVLAEGPIELKVSVEKSQTEQDLESTTVKEKDESKETNESSESNESSENGENGENGENNENNESHESHETKETQVTKEARDESDKSESDLPKPKPKPKSENDLVTENSSKQERTSANANEQSGKENLIKFNGSVFDCKVLEALAPFLKLPSVRAKIVVLAIASQKDQYKAVYEHSARMQNVNENDYHHSTKDFFFSFAKDLYIKLNEPAFKAKYQTLIDNYYGFFAHSAGPANQKTEESLHRMLYGNS